MMQKVVVIASFLLLWPCAYAILEHPKHQCKAWYLPFMVCNTMCDQHTGIQTSSKVKLNGKIRLQELAKAMGQVPTSGQL